MNLLRSLTATAFAIATAATPASAGGSNTFCYDATDGSRWCINRVIGLGGPNKRVWFQSRGAGTRHWGPEYVQDVYCDPNHKYNYARDIYGIACFEFSDL